MNLFKIIFILSLLSGCSSQQSMVSLESRVEHKFIGYWVNVNPNYNNWWVIQEDSIVNYGIALTKGVCTGEKAKIVGPSKINVPFGNKAVADLVIYEDLLIFKTPNDFAAHKRVNKNDICRKTNGKYYPGAPNTL
jgi:hypothetical protein